jgi:hypothetical protein
MLDGGSQSLLNGPWLTAKAPIFVELGRVRDIVNRAKSCLFCFFLTLSVNSTIPLKSDAPHIEDDIALYIVKDVEE